MGLERTLIPWKDFSGPERGLIWLEILFYFLFILLLEFHVTVILFFLWEAEAETEVKLRMTVLNLPIYSALPTSQFGQSEDIG